MLKITVVEGRRQCRLLVEGRLIAPWAAELTSAYENAKTGLVGRELIVDLRSLTAISPEGEAVLLQLMQEKAKFLRWRVHAGSPEATCPEAVRKPPRGHGRVHGF